MCYLREFADVGNWKTYWFKKAGSSRETARQAINEQDDRFKDLLNDLLKDTIYELSKRFPKNIPTELNEALLLENDAELYTSGGKLSDADILTETRGEVLHEEKADDALEDEKTV